MTLNNLKAGRRAIVKVRYENKDMSASISQILQSVTFSDSIASKGDSFTFTIIDKTQKFLNKWHPSLGAQLYSYAHLTGFDGTDKPQIRKFGYVELAGLDSKGPPNVVTLTGISIPKGRGTKDKRTKSYEKTSLKKISQLIAKRLKVKLLYKASESPAYDRVQQSKENDLVFLKRLCEEAGFVVKISPKSLTILDERDLESQPSKSKLKATDQKLLSFGFSETITEAYASCIVSYTDSKKKKTHKVKFAPKNGPKGDVLYVNEEFKTEAAGLKIAKNKLREANKGLATATMQYMGLINLYAGDCVDISGYGAFDGKYLITTIDGSLGGATTTSLQMRKVLSGY